MRLDSDGKTDVRKEVRPYGNGRTRMREWDEKVRVGWGGVGWGRGMGMVREC